MLPSVTAPSQFNVPSSVIINESPLFKPAIAPLETLQAHILVVCFAATL